jgi:dipeptidyl aminopeptidase/acylaminoacyl peptidase
VRSTGDAIVYLGASPARATAVHRLDLGSGAADVLRRSTESTLDEDLISVPRAVEFPTAGGATAFGQFYAPHNPGSRGPDGERPPLYVTSHGGPTAAASTGLNESFQVLTSRGIAVLDVDYGGSTGYGRAYRERLNGTWGVTDVDDCVAGARYLVESGEADGDRLIIEGGSASGYTTLCALTMRDTFKAGTSYFGIGDLETFVNDTHKFESRYLERLLGPYPERADLYRERSPIHFLDRLSAPMLILQGLDDRVVPPSQAEQMVAALRAKGLPYAYLAFEGEDHGFRKAENIVRSLEAELSFYAQIFGFTLADAIEPVPIEGLATPAR